MWEPHDARYVRDGHPTANEMGLVKPESFPRIGTTWGARKGSQCVDHGVHLKLCPDVYKRGLDTCVSMEI